MLKSFTHATGEVGEHQYKLVPHNSAGDGAESVVLTVQLAQQAAAEAGTFRYALRTIHR